MTYITGAATVAFLMAGEDRKYYEVPIGSMLRSYDDGQTWELEEGTVLGGVKVQPGLRIPEEAARHLLAYDHVSRTAERRIRDMFEARGVSQQLTEDLAEALHIAVDAWDMGIEEVVEYCECGRRDYDCTYSESGEHHDV